MRLVHVICTPFRFFFTCVTICSGWYLECYAGFFAHIAKLTHDPIWRIFAKLFPPLSLNFIWTKEFCLATLLSHPRKSSYLKRRVMIGSNSSVITNWVSGFFLPHCLPWQSLPFIPISNPKSGLFDQFHEVGYTLFRTFPLAFKAFFLPLPPYLVTYLMRSSRAHTWGSYRYFLFVVRSMRDCGWWFSLFNPSASPQIWPPSL